MLYIVCIYSLDLVPDHIFFMIYKNIYNERTSIKDIPILTQSYGSLKQAIYKYRKSNYTNRSL